MNSEKKNDEGAQLPETGHHEIMGVSGMSLRDYFAGQALIILMNKRDRAEPHFTTAKDAYKMADAMLREREKRNA